MDDKARHDKQDDSRRDEAASRARGWSPWLRAPVSTGRTLQAPPPPAPKPA